MEKVKKEEIFCEYIIPLSPQFYHMTYRILQSENGYVVAEDVDDIVQEAMEAIWKGMDTFSGQSKIVTRAYGILKHKIQDYIRKAILVKGKVHRIFCDEDEEEKIDISTQIASNADILEQILQKEKLKWLEMALQRLNDKDRELIIMRFLKELSLGEVAKIQGITVNALSVRQNRALKRLAKELEKIRNSEKGKWWE